MAQLDIFKLEPDAYRPGLQVRQHGEIIPPYQLPAGKVFILGKGPGWNVNQLLERGVTQIRHNDLSGLSESEKQALENAGKTYHSAVFTPELIGLPATDIMGNPANGPDEWVGNMPNMYNKLYFPNGLPTYAQAFQLGQRANVRHRITVGETKENNHYTNERHEFWAGYYDGKTPRLVDRFGNNYMQAHDYLFINIGPDWHSITEAQARAYFRNLPSLPNFDYTTGTLKHINLYVGDGYLGMPDRDWRAVYNIALKARMYKALGKKYAVFWDTEREAMPNMKNGQKMPSGVLYRENKMPAPGPVVQGMVFAGMHFGDGAIAWNAEGKVTDRKWSTQYMGQLAPGSFYVKNGETMQRPWQEWPYLLPGEQYTTVQWSCNEDAAAFAAFAYASTTGQVVGGVTKAARYKINNGPWYNPSNTFQDDLCYAKYHKQPIIETTANEGLESVTFMEPCANGRKKTVTVESAITGKQYTFEACGNTPHSGLSNI